MKVYLAELPLLTKPISREVLHLYLAVVESSLSSVLLREGSAHKSIYYVSKLIQGVELRYSEIEKTCLALMMTVWRLRPYFLSHQVIVCANFPLKQVLSRPDMSGRMVKWEVDLREYDIDYELRSTIKRHALVDFIQESTRPVEVKE